MALCSFGTFLGTRYGLVSPVRGNQFAPALVRFYAKTKKGKKKTQAVIFNPEISEGIVNIERLQKNMQANVEKLRQEFISKLSTRISPVIFDGVKVDTADGKVPLNRLAHIRMSKDKFIIDMSDSSKEIKAAVDAINNSGLNLVPNVDGKILNIQFPRMTQEYREILLKIARTSCEQAKVGIRRARQQGMSDVKKRKEGASKDDIKLIEKQIQALTDEHVDLVDKMLETKTEELLKK